MKNKKTLLKGEVSNQHKLYGDFLIEENQNQFAKITVKKESELKHEQPNGKWSNEHKTLRLDKGDWVMGLQVEWNPFSQSISMIWD